MTAKQVAQAFSAEALKNKSKVYIARALEAKARGSLGEYQLWASLALELIGKAALSSIHPSLIADQQSHISLFAAAGVTIGTDLKTIQAKTLFERLSHLSKRFDKKTQEYCYNTSLKRNSELHSGELPFEGVMPSSWEGRYWHTAEVILEITDETLESWLGAGQAKAPKELVADYVHFVSQAVKIRIETARDEFASRPKKEREEILARTAKLDSWGLYKSFDLLADEIWETNCPACTSKAFLAGVKYDENISEDDGEYSDKETVDVDYVAEEFRCPSCGLYLDTRNKIEAAGIEVDHTETETREREYEPDYGND